MAQLPDTNPHALKVLFGYQKVDRPLTRALSNDSVELSEKSSYS